MSNRINKWFLTMGIVIFTFTIFLTGVDVGNKDSGGAILNSLLALMWAGFIAIMTLELIMRLKLNMAKKELENLKSLLDTLTEAEKNLKIEEEFVTLLEDILKETTGGGRPPTKEEVVRIEQKFHDRTDFFAEITLEKDGMNVEISKKPFDKPFTTSETATTTKSTTRNPGTVLDNVKPREGFISRKDR